MFQSLNFASGPEPHSFEENLPRERIAVRVQSVGCETKNYVACFDPTAIDNLRAFNDPDDPTGEIVFALPIDSWHLRRFTADQRATGRATSARKSANELIENAPFQLFRADIIEKKQRTRAKRRDVVDTMGHQIDADGIVPVHREGHLQFCAPAS